MSPVPSEGLYILSARQSAVPWGGGGGGFMVPQEAGRGETHRLDASGGDWRRGVHEACVRACM